MTRAHGTMLAGAAILIAAAVFFFKESSASPASNAAGKSQDTAKVTAANPVRPARQATSFPPKDLPELPPPVTPPNPPGSAEDREWINSRLAALEDLAWFDDAESLRKILAELRNPLPELRSAALTATKSFGSRDAVPYLTAIASQTGDPLEQKAINEVIDYLNLPTLLEQTDEDSGK